MVAALPSSVTKFEQKAVLNIDTAENTSLVTFHAYHDILAVSIYTYIYMYTYVCIYIYVHIYIHMNVHAYIDIYT
jgi:hypothetical protein